MFNNPGQKIKNLAIASFIINCLAAVIGGIVLICDDYGWAGVATIAGGIFIAYVTALLLYGFGELIDKTCDIERHTWAAVKGNPENQLIKNSLTSASTVQTQSSNIFRTPKANEWKCTCGKIHQPYESSCICGKTKREVLSGNASNSQPHHQNS